MTRLIFFIIPEQREVFFAAGREMVEAQVGLATAPVAKGFLDRQTLVRLPQVAGDLVVRSKNLLDNAGIVGSPILADKPWVIRRRNVPTGITGKHLLEGDDVGL